MKDVNTVHLTGHLTRDPELRVTPKGTAVCSFSLASNYSSRSAEGTPIDETTFVDITAFGKTGETIAKYLSSGSPIYIEGRLRFEQWEDKTTGQKRNKLSVFLKDFKFLHRAPAKTAATEGTPTASQGNVDENVPF